jgi:hypothetical protein
MDIGLEIEYTSVIHIIIHTYIYNIEKIDKKITYKKVYKIDKKIKKQKNYTSSIARKK